MGFALNERTTPVFYTMLFLCVASILIVALRCVVRISIRGFGKDDVAIVLGQASILSLTNHCCFLLLLTLAKIFATCTFIVMMMACFEGLGQRSSHLTPLDSEHVRHVSLIRLATDESDN